MSDRFRTFEGVVEIPLALRADGPLLVKGPAAALPDRPDAAFVRYPPADGGEPTPYLPGSSLKGVLRSGAEALLRALGTPACNPLQARPRCAEQTGAGRPWNDRCAACYTFGSVRGAAVLLVDDGLPWPAGAGEQERAGRLEELERRLVVRTSVAVDRETGAASQGRLFDYEALVGAELFPTLRLRNPHPWQAALVAAALALLDDGTLRLGSATTRGFGRARATPVAMVARTVGDGGRLGPLLDGFGEPEPAGLLDVRRAADPAATLERWAGTLREWLP